MEAINQVAYFASTMFTISWICHGDLLDGDDTEQIPITVYCGALRGGQLYHLNNNLFGSHPKLHPRRKSHYVKLL